MIVATRYPNLDDRCKSLVEPVGGEEQSLGKMVTELLSFKIVENFLKLYINDGDLMSLLS